MITVYYYKFHFILKIFCFVFVRCLCMAINNVNVQVSPRYYTCELAAYFERKIRTRLDLLSIPQSGGKNVC